MRWPLIAGRAGKALRPSVNQDKVDSILFLAWLQNFSWRECRRGSKKFKNHTSLVCTFWLF